MILVPRACAPCKLMQLLFPCVVHALGRAPFHASSLQGNRCIPWFFVPSLSLAMRFCQALPLRLGGRSDSWRRGSLHRCPGPQSVFCRPAPECVSYHFANFLQEGSLLSQMAYAVCYSVTTAPRRPRSQGLTHRSGQPGPSMSLRRVALRGRATFGPTCPWSGLVRLGLGIRDSPLQEGLEIFGASLSRPAPVALDLGRECWTLQLGALAVSCTFCKFQHVVGRSLANLEQQLSVLPFVPCRDSNPLASWLSVCQVTLCPGCSCTPLLQAFARLASGFGAFQRPFRWPSAVLVGGVDLCTLSSAGSCPEGFPCLALGQQSRSMLYISEVHLLGMAGRRGCLQLVRAISSRLQWLLPVLALGQLSAWVRAALLPSIRSCPCKPCPSGLHRLSAPLCVALPFSVSLDCTLAFEPSAKFRFFLLPFAARCFVRSQFIHCLGRALYRMCLGRSIHAIQSLPFCVATQANTVLAVLCLARLAVSLGPVSCLCALCTPGTRQLSALPCVALLLRSMPERNACTEPPAQFRLFPSLLAARRCVRAQFTPRRGRTLCRMWSSLSRRAEWSFPLLATRRLSAMWLVLCLVQPALRDVQPAVPSVSHIGLIQLSSYPALLKTRDPLARTWNCYAGVRVGEASHPGPTRSQPTLHQLWGRTPSSPEPAPPDCCSGDRKAVDSLRVVVVNPTAVLDKEHALHTCRAHVLFLAETSATAGTQVGVGANLAKLGYSTFWSKPVAPHATPSGQPESRRGCAGGAAVVTTLRAHHPFAEVDEFLMATQRVAVSTVRFGLLAVRAVAVYGYPANHADALEKNQELFSAVFSYLAPIRGPVLVGGDFNCDVTALPCWAAYQSAGYHELHQLHAVRFGVKLPNTCRGATAWDSILLSTSMVSLYQGAHVDTASHTFDAHAPVVASFACPHRPMALQKWRLPHSWVHLEPDPALVDQFYAQPCQVASQVERAKRDGNLAAAFELWGRKWERAVHKALQASDPATPSGSPGSGLPRSYRGRCKPRSRAFVPVPASAPSGRQGTSTPRKKPFPWLPGKRQDRSAGWRHLSEVWLAMSPKDASLIRVPPSLLSGLPFAVPEVTRQVSGSGRFAWHTLPSFQLNCQSSHGSEICTVL